MYESGSGSGSVLGISTTTAGIVILPNTGSNTALLVVAVASIVIGSLIVLSTIIRMVAKKSLQILTSPVKTKGKDRKMEGL